MSNYAKLKTNLKLSIQRLKLLEKKKTELSLKSRKEIADYLAINKIDRARIRVEHIIREDNFVEAMEMLEMFCDLLLARFGLIEKMKELDPGLDEAIATIIWSSPRISNDIQEFKTIGDILTSKYGKHYAEACKSDSLKNVNEKVKKRLGLEPPSKLLVEQYLVEISKNFNVAYKPDPSVMVNTKEVDDLINLGYTSNNTNNTNNNNRGSGGAGGGGGSGVASGLGFDSVAQAAATKIPSSSSSFDDHNYHFPEKNSSKLNSDGDFHMPVLPPPLPKTGPTGDIFPPAPPNYKENDENNYNKNYNRYDDGPIYDNNLDYGYHEKPRIDNNGPVVVTDPNVPLPYKPGAHDGGSPPPTYEPKQPTFPNLQYNTTPVKPTAPEQSYKLAPTNSNRINSIDLPSVPDDLPQRPNVNNQKDDEDDMNFDDLQKRFQNLKKL